MTIGQLAKAAAVNVETIRYYQRRGLISTPAKPLGGQRRYPEQALKQISFIRRAQKLSFTLDEVMGLLALASGRNCKKVRALAKEKLESVEQRLLEIKRTRRQLIALIKRCDKNPRGSLCPIILALSAEEDTEAANSVFGEAAGFYEDKGEAA